MLVSMDGSLDMDCFALSLSVVSSAILSAVGLAEVEGSATAKCFSFQDSGFSG